MESWTCSTCGKQHSGLPQGYSYDAPLFWYTVPEEERESRCVLNPDYCVIDNRDYFVRGCLEIPVVGQREPFIWGVWVSLSESNFERELRLADDPARTNEPAYFGWLSTRIEIYPDTIALKTNVHTRRIGVRPFIEVEAVDHPLSAEQRDGISVKRVIEIAEKVEHGWRHPLWDAKHA